MTDDRRTSHPHRTTTPAVFSEVPTLLDRVRPQWQSRRLIDRVRRLLEVDPSSACQRILNAAFHDLREKVVIAGLDIAVEAARTHKLPSVGTAEDLEGYPAAKLLDLSYRMGLLSRPDWRRLCRCYEIRRDLEHEDDEYEAQIEDCIYVFKTCVEAVLSRDPVQPIRVSEVKEVINQPGPTVPSSALLHDYKGAPQPRQEEILKFLIGVSLDEDQPDIVRANSQRALAVLGPLTQQAVKLRLVDFFVDHTGNRGLDLENAAVAVCAGLFPYLRQADRESLFESVLARMRKVGTNWMGYDRHGALLRDFLDIGGLSMCTVNVRHDILLWLVLTYIGTPGGQTRYGNVRHVFYSNSAAPLIRELVHEARNLIGPNLRELQRHRVVRNATVYPHVARRLEDLLDLVEASDGEQ